MPSVILVDDHQLVTDGFSKLINDHANFEVMSSYCDPKEALEKIPILKPDIVISDIDMPGIDGLTLIEQLFQKLQEIKFIVITMHMDQTLIQKVKSLGVLGFLPKNTEAFELQQCLNAVWNGRPYYSQKALEMAMSIAKPIAKSTYSKKTDTLTDREREILTMIASGKSTREISEALFIAVRTVETHRKNIMEKIGVNNVAGMVRIAVQEGLLE